MIEDIEQDVQESYDITRWPAELETSGSVAEDALRVQRHVQAARVAVNKLPAADEVIRPPTFQDWVMMANGREYQTLFTNASKDDLVSITYDRIAEATNYDKKLKHLRNALQSQDAEDVEDALGGMGRPKIGRGVSITALDLTIHEDCVMVQNRVWIPAGLATEIAAILHLGHKSKMRMFKVATGTCYWPGMTNTLEDIVTECQFCRQFVNLPPTPEKSPSPEPVYPGEMISIDVGQTKGGKNFLCIADRFSGYIWVRSVSGAGTSKQIIELIMTNSWLVKLA